jgi:hypothetical protein
MIEKIAEWLRKNPSYQISMRNAYTPENNQDEYSEIRVRVVKYIQVHPFTRSVEISIFGDGGSDAKFLECLTRAEKELREY